MVRIRKLEKYGYIELEGKMSDVHFVADSHFLHGNIIRVCNRPFINKEEMTSEMIKRWNEVVKPDDIVFNLGDFCWSRQVDEWKKLLDQLNGKQVFILGNHDYRTAVEKVEERFITVRESIELRFDKYRYMLHHYPQVEWNGSYHGVFAVYGHVHNNIPNWCKPTQLCVSVEQTNYYPISLVEVTNRLANQIGEYEKNRII